MTQVIVDAAMRTKLGDLTQPLELCDESGTVLARLVPALDASRFDPVEPPLSTEELRRRRQEPEFSTVEVLAYLKSL